MHNLLVTGGEHVNRFEYARHLAKHHLCVLKKEDGPCHTCKNCLRVHSNTHPNLVLIEPALGTSPDDELVSGMIKIEQVRRVIEEHHKTNFEDGVLVFVITHMHRLTKGAANALLKVLEENSAKKIFIGLSPSRMAVLPTIASRLTCHIVQPAIIDTQASNEIKEKIRRICEMKPSARFLECMQFSSERDALLKELDEIMSACHEMLREKTLSPRYVLPLSSALERAQNNLKKNLNPRMVTEVLVLSEWPFTKK